MEAKQSNTRVLHALSELIEPLGLSVADTGGCIEIFGADPLFPSAVRLGEAFSIAAMAQAVGAAAIWRERTGEGQNLCVDIRQAAHSIVPEFTFHPTINGHSYPNWMGNMHPFGVFPFRTADGRWVYPSGVYPHQHFAWSNFFNCGLSHANIAAAIAKWNAAELEDTANAKGHTLCIARSAEEWLAHPQGRYLANEPVIVVRKIGEGPLVPLAPAKRPLEGIRVLSLTHAIAGPVVGRTLAEQGADVLCVNRPNDFEHAWVYDDANVGARSTFLDLNDPEQNRTCKALAQTADVFVDSYRGRKMAEFGLSPAELAALRPGIIVVSVRCYGWDGPWFDRGGFDMLGSAASGLAMLEGVSGMPALPPTVAGHLRRPRPREVSGPRIGRDNDDPYRQLLRLNGMGELNAGKTRHLHIGQQNVGSQRAHHRQRVFAVTCPANDMEIVFKSEQGGDGSKHQRLVFGDDDADLRAHAGTLATRVVPDSDWMTNAPPAATSRCRIPVKPFPSTIAVPEPSSITIRVHSRA
ncbi:hypothetical protein FHS83_000136 [Rhizomicrobium palustre]|uniref:Uncharacterized protein n=1 Tax=Rhizomicrobium palustre TaxID=189966 RepID=A0A846MTJ0_9PROT|nr:hypothetical protein [Rhizomicrobium palustre]